MHQNAELRGNGLSGLLDKIHFVIGKLCDDWHKAMLYGDALTLYHTT